MTDMSEDHSTGDEATSALRLWLPHIFVVCWLLYLGVTIWVHALHSVQPPYYDPLSYMSKAANFWRAVHSGRVFNPLNLDNTARPPGTILMSYPFGMTPDFHGFYFRSVFLPVLSIVAAIYIVAGIRQAKARGWQIAAMAFLLSSIPMFYWMDWDGGFYGWGMVDTFQAGIAALAAAAVLRSQATKSRNWLLFGALLSSFTLLIKPSGLMIMVLIFTIWSVPTAFEWRATFRHQRPADPLKTYVYSCVMRFLVSYAFIITLCVFSRYLSPRNFIFAGQALAVMKKVLATTSFLPLFHRSWGEWLPLWLLMVSVLIIHQLFGARRGKRDTGLRSSVLLLAALVTWISGAWYWIVLQAGESQIRFFYPFMLMGCICVIPPALQVWPRTTRPTRLILMAICLLPAGNMAALLAAGDSPSKRWQNFTGVSVSVGSGGEELSQAYAFLEEVRKTGKDQLVYFFPNSDLVQTSFALVGDYEKQLRPDLASFYNEHPLDWARGFAVRIRTLLSCDYILVNKRTDADIKRYLSLAYIESFETEKQAFECWVFAQDEQSGLQIASEGQKLRLLRVADPIALNRAIDRFVSVRKWRPEFKAANPPLWWDEDTPRPAARGLEMQEIGYGGVYRLHVVRVSRVKRDIHIDVWWEELRQEEANNDRYLCFYLVDRSGKSKYRRQISLFPYRPPDFQKRWRFDQTTFDGAMLDPTLTSIAFEVNQQGNEPLLLDNSTTPDGKGRRIVIPLSSIPSADGK